MKRTYTKADSSHCRATFSVVTHYWENGVKSYTGSIQFSENGMRLFTHHVPVDRTTKIDALLECAEHLTSGEFGEWITQ